jgi:hypothetical protein
VFATECLRMIVTACEVDETHFDMEKARNRKNTTGQGMCIYLALCMYLLSIYLNFEYNCIHKLLILMQFVF